MSLLAHRVVSRCRSNLLGFGVKLTFRDVRSRAEADANDRRDRSQYCGRRDNADRCAVPGRGSARRALAGAEVWPQSACPCSTACRWEPVKRNSNCLPLLLRTTNMRRTLPVTDMSAFIGLQ